MRRLAPEEAALWKKVITTVKPMVRAEPVKVAEPIAAPAPARSPPKPDPKVRRGTPVVAKAPAAKPAPPSAETLDGTWDRRLSRGVVAPESSIDLHGHSLAAAYARLDRGLEHAIARGDRVLLLVTGKPPVAESERPHSRGAIRAAVGDWLASSRFADRIAAVRNAHPRHGGTGALYIVLRRPRTTALRKS